LTIYNSHSPGRYLQALLAHNAKVYIAARSKEKAEKAIEELQEQTGRKGIWLKLDLADLNSVKAAAEEFIRYESYNVHSLEAEFYL
jgi:NAD(P)-dependent dehydrogenase (short-subunit alcohol dehydrogenase family)